MSLENQDRESAARPIELQGTSMEEVHRRSRTVYTREFLLAIAELNDYNKCLTEFDPSLLRELEDDTKDMQEPWKKAGIMFLPNSGNINCRVQFSGWDSGSSSWDSGERSNYLSLITESNSYRNYHSDPLRQNDLHVSACKSKDTARRYQVTEKDDYSQLRKSEDPYRPPHTYQGGRTKYEIKSHSKKTVKEKMDSGIQEDTQLEWPGIAEGEQLEIKDATSLAESDFSFPVFKPFPHDYDSQLTRNNSKKANMSIIRGYLNEEKSRMTLKEDPVSSLEDPSSSTVIEKALPQSLMVNSDSEKRFSGKTCFNSGVGNIGFHMIQSDESISKMEFNESFTNRPFNSVQIGSFNRIPSIEVSGLQHPFTLDYDIVSSSLREHIPIRTNHQGITPDAVEVIDSNNMEEDECTFDDMWSEIMEIVQLEQEMKYNSAAESNQTAGFKVQISLPDDHSLISSGNPADSEHLTFVPLNRSNNISHYDADIHLLNQDSLITNDNLIAPEDRSVSIDYLRRVECSKFVPPKSCSKAADYAEIYFPSEDVLTTMDDIKPNRLKFMASGLPEADGAGMSSLKNEVPRPGTLITRDLAKGSATQGQEVPPPLDVTPSQVHQELHFHPPSLHSHCNSSHHEKTTCYPLNSLQSQTIPQSTFMDPVPFHCYPALQWYSCPNTVHQFPGRTASPKLKELCHPHVQYSRLQKPTNFLQHPLPIKNMAFSNLEVGKKQPFSLRHHQRTAYPDLTIANSGFDHHMVDSTMPKHEPQAWQGQRTPY